MKNKKTLVIFFVFVVIAQLYVPASMIMNREDILATGKVFQFKTAPVDPTDFMRGKYITLNYEANSYEVDSEKAWERRELVFVQLGVDAQGYAKIESVFQERPKEGVDYVEAKINYVKTYKSPPTLIINYPFNRYYMEESKAPIAEKTYRNVQKDSTQVAYAVVSVKNGDAVLSDVMINEVSIKNYIEDEN